eukprot:TRINITY_DN93424_c0_g1_i1.p1 TRINITY_DN93424_c0_g1~~TRINITY_DN93424_c0_g1_i1.p1  ORF type:complete len:473 (-),score=99.25 TRINITY_DN93424_c0_g1_i1:2-1420(-)
MDPPQLSQEEIATNELLEQRRQRLALEKKLTQEDESTVGDLMRSWAQFEQELEASEWADRARIEREKHHAHVLESSLQERLRVQRVQEEDDMWFRQQSTEEANEVKRRKQQNWVAHSALQEKEMEELRKYERQREEQEAKELEARKAASERRRAERKQAIQRQLAQQEREELADRMVLVQKHIARQKQRDKEEALRRKLEEEWNTKERQMKKKLLAEYREQKRLQAFRDEVALARARREFLRKEEECFQAYLARWESWEKLTEKTEAIRERQTQVSSTSSLQQRREMTQFLRQKDTEKTTVQRRTSRSPAQRRLNVSTDRRSASPQSFSEVSRSVAPSRLSAMASPASPVPATASVFHSNPPSHAPTPFASTTPTPPPIPVVWPAKKDVSHLHSLTTEQRRAAVQAALARAGQLVEASLAVSTSALTCDADNDSSPGEEDDEVDFERFRAALSFDGDASELALSALDDDLLI